MPSHPPAIAITGIGVVSPYGVGREDFWSHVRKGCSTTALLRQVIRDAGGVRVA